MRRRREYTKHTDFRLNLGVRFIDDAERRFAPRHIEQRIAHILRPRQTVCQRIPGTERHKRGPAVAPGRHEFRIGHRQFAARSQQRGEINPGVRATCALPPTGAISANRLPAMILRLLP
nr:hypothetical protein [Hankyongella ginsenosidimutans]